MAILIGMDEAGYGPNLGPLVVAATAWEVAEGAGGRGQGAGKAIRGATHASATALASSATTNLPQYDLYYALRGVVSRAASERSIAIADSKALYKPGQGLRLLERGVYGVLGAMGRAANCWSRIVDCCSADPAGCHRQLCWHDGFDCALPVDATAEELAPLGERLARVCKKRGVRPLVMRARFVFPAEFNELTERFGSKGAALSHVTVGLLREVVDGVREEYSVLSTQYPDPQRSAIAATTPHQSPAPSPQPPVFAVCDKHGARNRYAALLQHHFPDDWIEPLVESAAESRYEWGPAEARMHVAFRVKGESFLPTALASMTAKYLRELSMRAFNEFWCARVPGLRPTAGYPMDAPRFKREIAALQRELGIDDRLLWRNR